MIAEELFTGKEKTVEESESVVSNVSTAEEENKTLLEVQKGQSKSGEQLFDLSKEKAEETTEKESSGGSPDDEDWLSSLEQELNEEAEEKKVEKTEKAEKAEKKDGEELVSMCPKCNYKNRPDAWYCENCGSELSSPA